MRNLRAKQKLLSHAKTVRHMKRKLRCSPAMKHYFRGVFTGIRMGWQALKEGGK